MATYSYWHFTRNKYPIEKVIDHAAELGVEGLLQMDIVEPEPEPESVFEEIPPGVDGVEARLHDLDQVMTDYEDRY